MMPHSGTEAQPQLSHREKGSRVSQIIMKREVWLHERQVQMETCVWMVAVTPRDQPNSPARGEGKGASSPAQSAHRGPASEIRPPLFPIRRSGHPAEQPPPPNRQPTWPHRV